MFQAEELGGRCACGWVSSLPRTQTDSRVAGWAGLRQTKKLQIDLHQVDTHEAHHGEAGRWRSALEVVVDYEVSSFVKHPLLTKLVSEKWQKFARSNYFFFRVCPYVIIFSLFVTVVYLRSIEVREEWGPLRAVGGTQAVASDLECVADLPLHGADNGSPSPVGCKDGILSWLHNLKTQPEDRYARLVASVAMEGLLTFGLAPLLFYLAYQAGHRSYPTIAADTMLARRAPMDVLFRNLDWGLDLLTGASLFLAGLMRYVCRFDAEMSLLALSSILLFCNSMSLLLPFRELGPLVVTIWRMAIGDTKNFLIIYVLALLGFSFAMCILSQVLPCPLSVLSLHGFCHFLPLSIYLPPPPPLSLLTLFFVSLLDKPPLFSLVFYALLPCWRGWLP